MKLKSGTLLFFAVLMASPSGRAEEKFATPFDLMLHQNLFRPLISPMKTLSYSTSGSTKKNPRVKVNGCSKDSVFMTSYGMPPSRDGKRKAPKCDKALAMHPQFAKFLDENLPACLERAANNALGHDSLSADLRSTENRIFHHGCVGDSKHQRTGSWHNEALALDVTGFQIGKTVLRYEDAKKNDAEGRRAAQFFTHLRRCWGEKVASYSSSCRQTGARGQPPGSIGNENKNHQVHLHLSLPCKNISNGRSTYLADLLDLLPAAWAEDEEPTLNAPIYVDVKLAKAKMKLTIEDTGGEPVNADVRMTLSESCSGRSKPQVVFSDLYACAYDGFEKGGEGSVILRYRTAILDDDGVLACKENHKEEIPSSCP